MECANCFSRHVPLVFFSKRRIVGRLGPQVLY
uniref:Uncharacterized protein n=1 Tax=Arundo donax TaxID=35708 RepID=A0A0A8ZEV0_ARUDO